MAWGVQSTRIGCILNIPGIVMSTIVLSSGTSVPDSLSSIVVARKGEGDMAIASHRKRARRPTCGPPLSLGHKSTTHNAPPNPRAQTLAITKFPVLHDFSFYILSVILFFFLLFFALDQKIVWYESQFACVQSTRVGCILNIPGIVMGTIVLSSGTSVPDSLSSIVVARKGEGDMAIAIANVLGVQRAEPPLPGAQEHNTQRPSPPPSPAQTLAITKFPVLCDFSFCILSVILLFFLLLLFALDQKIVCRRACLTTAARQ